MPPEANDVRVIFLAAVEKPTAAERAAFLDGACRGDADLRRRVEARLKAHDEPGGVPDRPAVDRAVTVDDRPGPDEGSDDTPTVGERPGLCLGPYKLLQRLGDGGMGAVWMAEQEQP